MWLGLVAAAVIAASISAAQLLPVIEFIQQTNRAIGGLHGLYHFSVEPYRLGELIWPNVAGVNYGENSYWPEVVRLPGVYPKLWVPSLYLGGLTVVLAAVALGLRQGPPWRVWLSAIAIVSAWRFGPIHRADLDGADSHRLGALPRDPASAQRPRPG